ncbi:MAG: hypothetical protein JSW25_07850 [Thermoplasmata archaeon]|nr:MAG: hypothetical protein JSW25_07850 [Thermoplasmata archaeon]
MAVSVQEIINGARDTHESFTPEIHPNSVCLAYLSRYHRTLVLRIVALDPFRLAAVQSITKATWVAGWDKGDTGVAALDHHIYMDGRANLLDSDSWDILSLAAWGARPREFRQVNDSFWPAYSVVGGNIYFHGDQVDWDRFASVDIYYVPMSPDLTLAGNITIPDTAESAMVAGLAHFLAHRSHNSPGGPNVAALRQNWVDEERLFMDQVAGYSSRRSSATLDVW